MAGDKPNPTQRPAPARGPGGGALQQRKRPARTASGGRRPQQQPGILRFYAEETPGLKIGPTTVPRPRRFLLPFIHGRIDGVTWWRSQRAQVLVMSVMFVGFMVLLHIYGKLTAVPDAVDEDPIMPETPGADAP